MRRGRPDPETLHVGDTVDWWRVEAYEPNRVLRLRAEMRLPGRAWLEFEVRPGEGATLIQQTALFEPSGLLLLCATSTSVASAELERADALWARRAEGLRLVEERATLEPRADQWIEDLAIRRDASEILERERSAR